MTIVFYCPQYRSPDAGRITSDLDDVFYRPGQMASCFIRPESGVMMCMPKVAPDYIAFHPGYSCSREVMGVFLKRIEARKRGTAR